MLIYTALYYQQTHILRPTIHRTIIIIYFQSIVQQGGRGRLADIFVQAGRTRFQYGHRRGSDCGYGATVIAHTTSSFHR
jgi:hypothetical protein